MSSASEEQTLRADLKEVRACLRLHRMREAALLKEVQSHVRGLSAAHAELVSHQQLSRGLQEESSALEAKLVDLTNARQLRLVHSR